MPLLRHRSINLGFCFCFPGLNLNDKYSPCRQKYLQDYEASTVKLKCLFGKLTACLYQLCQQQNEAICQKAILIEDASVAQD